MNTLEQAIREKLVDLKQQGVSINDLAKRTGAQQASLSKFMRGKGTITVATLEKLWPFLYGDQPQQKASGE